MTEVVRERATEGHALERKEHREGWSLYPGHYVLGLIVAWTAAVGADLGWNASSVKQHSLDAAYSEARVSSERDFLFRRWVAGHGGVYALATEKTPPNPNLAHLPERDAETPSGRHLTLMNPAYVMRQLYESSQEPHGFRGHPVSLKPIRPENAPDAWERNALLAFERGETEVSSMATLEGEPYMRFVRPLVVQESCLKCHAGQGYKIGDIRGGFSILIPMAPYRIIESKQMLPLVMGHASIWVLGLIGIAVGAWRIRGQVAKRQDVEEQLRISLGEKESLLREIHHRVKNNMQVMTSLISLQSQTIKSGTTPDPFEGTRDRIKAMALVHETLYQSENLADFDCQEYVQKLGENLCRAYGKPHARVEVNVEVGNVSLVMDNVVPVGLILNELVSNSLKHAFPDERPGEIRIAMHSVGEDEIEMIVSDNGTGIPQEVGQNSKGLGLWLVAGLVQQQLGGSLETNRDKGTQVTIRFKQKPAKPRV